MALLEDGETYASWYLGNPKAMERLALVRAPTKMKTRRRGGPCDMMYYGITAHSHTKYLTSEMDPKENVQNIELTIVQVQALPPPTLLDKFHLEVRADCPGSRAQKITSSRESQDAKFVFDLAGSKDLKLSLYKNRIFGQTVLDTTTIHTGLKPRNQDLTETFVSKGRSITVTYQLQDCRANFRKARCPVFALVIGINAYQSNDIPNLQGCVNDAQNVKTYLSDRFSIPEAQIACLVNEQATRTAILGKIKTHLIENTAIEKWDTIIIYYAGHGSRVTPPDSWLRGPDDKIETLVPHDERKKSWRGKVVHGIPDRTMNALLGRLASVKGDNITVILDCCYSASCTRELAKDIRCVETPRAIPEKLDQHLLDGHPVLHVGINDVPINSHVLLAACGQHEVAREMTSKTGKRCGRFTQSLIEQLRGIGSKRTTYRDVIRDLPKFPDQNPECEGEHKNRYIFEVEGPDFE